jgi:hypothetical protein
VVEQQRDQQPAHPAVPVEKRVNRLELHVREAGPHDDRQITAFVVQKPFEARHALQHPRVRRRDEARIPGLSAADPVLRAAELTWILARAAPAGEQHAVQLADQAIRERKALAQPRQPMVESRNVVGDFDHVVERHARRLLQLEQQEVRDCVPSIREESTASFRTYA